MSKKALLKEITVISHLTKINTRFKVATIHVV